MTNNSATPRPAAPWVAQPHPDAPLDAEVQDGAAPHAGQEHEPPAEHADGALPHEFAAASRAGEARTATDRTPAGQNAPARAGEASRRPLRLADSPAPSTPAPAGAPGPVPPWGRGAAAQFDTPPPPKQTSGRRPTEQQPRPVDAPPARRTQLPPPAGQLPPPATAEQPGPRHSGERSTATCCFARRNAPRPRGGGGWCTASAGAGSTPGSPATMCAATTWWSG